MVRISPLRSTPSRKGGKAAKTKKQVQRAEEEANIFKIFLESHDDPSPRDSLSKFQEYINYLSIAKLNNMHRKITSIEKQVLTPKSKKICLKARESIDEKIRYSEDEEKNLFELIKAKLKQLCISAVKRTPSGTLTHVKVNGKWMIAARFVLTYLKEEYELADSLIADGILLVPHQLHGPMAVVRKIISLCLHKAKRG